MHNISRKTNRKFIFKNCLLLSTVCIGLLFSENVRAELWVTEGTYSALTTTNNEYVKKYSLAETDDTNTFTQTQTFTDLTFSTEGSATVNTISTNISSSSTDNELITAKAVYDALENAGVDDMLTKTEADGTYAKSDDVYSKTEADGK